MTPDPRPTRRGGRRPGAGAPRGNLNALRHGLRSAQFAELGALLASIPETRGALLDLARRHKMKQRKAEEMAVLLLGRLIHRARQIASPEPGQRAEGRSNVERPVHERRSIRPTRAGPDAPDPTTQ